MASFCCTIEMEPKTLNEGQITHAREVAVDIFQNKEPNEASSVFVEGLKPVVGMKEMAQRDLDYKLEDKTNINETCCQCSLASAIIDSPDQSKLKEPLSAPF